MRLCCILVRADYRLLHMYCMGTAVPVLLLGPHLLRVFVLIGVDSVRLQHLDKAAGPQD